MPMVRAHADDPSNHPTGGGGAGGAGGARGDSDGSSAGVTGGCRLNLLLSYGGWQPESWVDVLPRLLEPMGVRAVRARSGHEAAQVIRSTPVHIAVVDLSLPLEAKAVVADAPHAAGVAEFSGAAPGGEEGGERIMELLQRLECPPPTVIVKRRRTGRENARSLSKALMSGAFAVLEPPVNIELALEVMRRILHRHYAGRWPSTN